MEPVQDESELQAQIQRLRGVRDAAADHLKAVEQEIGTVAGQYMAVSKYPSYSAVARSLGVSHTFVKTLIEKARARPEADDDARWRTPFLRGPDAARYVQTIGASITRVIASFSEVDMLYASRLSPGAFVEEGALGPRLHFPNMMWQLDDDRWVGVDHVNVGYGGTGPGLARRALIDAGIDKDLAKEISWWRFSDTDVATGRVEGQDSWPKYNLRPPLYLAPDYFKIEFDTSSLTEHRQFMDPDGLVKVRPPGGEFAEMIDYLNGDDLPNWLRGPRVARIFLDDNAAIAQGFAKYAAPLVIEQGEVQLWLQLYRSTDPSVFFDDAVYDALAVAGLYPAELAEHDRRGFIWRSVNSIRTGRLRAPFYDISQDGFSGGLRNVPNPAQAE